MADYVLSKTDEVYVILVLNPVVFEKDLSELLTYKENTVYRAAGTGPAVSIEVTGDYSGLLYILTHECTHIVDYVDRITPYIEPGINTLFGETENPTPFTDPHWSSYHEPNPLPAELLALFTPVRIPRVYAVHIFQVEKRFPYHPPA